MNRRTGTRAAGLRLPVGALLAAGLLAALPGAERARAGTWDAYVAPASTCTDETALDLSPPAAEAAMGCLVNYARTRRHLKPLTLNAALNIAARLKLAADRRCGEFSHTPCGLSFTKLFYRSGYLTKSTRAYEVGENLAWGKDDSGTPREIMAGWLASPGHNANIFSPHWRDMGVAYVELPAFLGYTRVGLWSNTFGSRR